MRISQSREKDLEKYEHFRLSVNDFQTSADHHENISSRFDIDSIFSLRILFLLFLSFTSKLAQLTYKTMSSET